MVDTDVAEPDSTTREGPLPLALPTDREAIEVGYYASLASAQPKLCRVKSTSHLEDLWVSTGLLEEVRRNPQLSIAEPPAPLPFTEAGNLF